MRDLAFHLAAGSLAERKAAELRLKLRTRPHTHSERDDAETLATIYEAAAYDLLARGRRSAPASPAPAKTRQQRRVAQATTPPVETWQAEIDIINAGPSDYIARSWRDASLGAIATVKERDKLIAQMLRDDAKLETLNKQIGRVADIGDETEIAA